MHEFFRDAFVPACIAVVAFELAGAVLVLATGTAARSQPCLRPVVLSFDIKCNIVNSNEDFVP